MYMRMSCANGCVVALDWYLPPMFFRSGVLGAGVLIGGVCGAGVIRCTRGSMPVMGRLV